MSKIMFSLFIAIFLSSGVIGQAITIKGTVHNKHTKEPVPFSSVMVYQGDHQLGGTATSLSGEFNLELKAKDSLMLLIGNTGYEVCQMLINSNDMKSWEIEFFIPEEMEAENINEYHPNVDTSRPDGMLRETVKNLDKNDQVLILPTRFTRKTLDPVKKTYRPGSAWHDPIVDGKLEMPESINGLAIVKGSLN